MTECGSLFESFLFPGARRTRAGHSDAWGACLVQAVGLTTRLPCYLGLHRLVCAPPWGIGHSRFCPRFSRIWFPCTLRLLALSSKGRTARYGRVATLRGGLCGYSHRPSPGPGLTEETCSGYISLFCCIQQRNLGLGWAGRTTEGRTPGSDAPWWLNCNLAISPETQPLAAEGRAFAGPTGARTGQQAPVYAGVGFG